MIKHALFGTKSGIRLAILLTAASFSPLLAQNKEIKDSEMLDSYIKSGNDLGVIVFDSTNIKQFWVNHSVLSRDNLINISLEKGARGWNSVFLPIQLANVNESMDCKVSVVTDNPNLSFSVFDSKSKKLSDSSKEEDFIQYHIMSSSFHLENANDFMFNIQFSSIKPVLSIKKVFLTLSSNKDSLFLASPGILKVSKDSVLPSAKTRLGESDFEITGVQSQILTQKNILVSDNTIKTTVTVKNVGNTSSRLYIGYSVQAKDGKKIDSRNYPYNNANKILHVVSAEKGSKSIIVDSVAECSKGCKLVQDAKEDLSDIPNFNLIGDQIEEFRTLENGNMEIIMNAPLKNEVEKGTKVRIHGKGGAFVYMNNKTLKPGEEETFTSSIQKDDAYLEYSPKALSRGVYYVKPVILSHTSGSTEENTVLIEDYNVSY